MPIAKHRPNFAELISHAAMQRQRHIDRVKNLFNKMTTEKQRKFSTSTRVADVYPEVDVAVEGGGDENTTIFVSLATLVSTCIHVVVSSVPMHIMRLAAIILAFVVLTMHTAGDISESTRRSLYITDKVVDIYFITFGVLSCISAYSNSKVRLILGGGIDFWDIVRMSCCIDIVTSVIAMGLGQSTIAVWFRMLRLMVISTFALQNLPHIDVLVSGISLGVRSLISTWLLLTLTFVVYSACGMTFFGKNDPAHFGTMAMSMWTFFQLATLDNWSAIMYINIYGCDGYPSDYVVVGNTTGVLTNVNRYGTMLLSVCSRPMKRPIVASIIFVSFILLCGFILISLTIASVTSGINDRLGQLEKEEFIRENTLAAQPMNSLLMDRDMLLMLMLEVWKRDEAYQKQVRKKSRRKMQQRESIRRSESLAEKCFSFMTSCNPLDIKMNSIFMRNMTNHYLYRYLTAFLLAFAAFLELWVIQHPNSSRLYVERLQLILQFIFSLDIAFKLLANYPACAKFFNDGWNIFDFVLVVGTWVPIFTVGQPGHEYFGLLRVFRILRLLRLLSWIADLNIMLRAISSSAKAMVYVILLMFLFFYNFAIMGVLLFRENDHYHFGDLFKAVLTLFQVSTLDDWSEVAKTNMYGCDYYGYDSGEDYYDLTCEHPRGLGWLAAWYFLIFIVFGVMVLVSLFVGIIITSMELLKEGIKEESEVWQKVREMQKGFNMRDNTVDNLLEIFDLIDIGKNGKLTLPELKPVLELVSVTQTDQFSLFMMVDKDSSGQIDFAEFIQLIYLMGRAYNRNIRKLRKESTVHVPDDHVLTHGFGSPGNVLNYMGNVMPDEMSPVPSDCEDNSDGEGFECMEPERGLSIADAQALALLQGDSMQRMSWDGRDQSLVASGDSSEIVQECEQSSPDLGHVMNKSADEVSFEPSDKRIIGAVTAGEGDTNIYQPEDSREEREECILDADAANLRNEVMLQTVLSVTGKNFSPTVTSAKRPIVEPVKGKHVDEREDETDIPDDHDSVHSFGSCSIVGDKRQGAAVLLAPLDHLVTDTCEDKDSQLDRSDKRKKDVRRRRSTSSNRALGPPIDMVPSK